MHKISFKASYLLILIPLSIVIFTVMPQIERTYYAYHDQHSTLKLEIVQCDSLQQIARPTTSELHKIKILKGTIALKTKIFGKQKFTYYKIGGMLIILVLMGIGMFITSFLMRRKKTSSGNREIDFSFEDSSLDEIGKQVLWDAKEGSGSNFASEIFKKAVNGYKITSTSYTKVIAWSFFLVGLEYTLLSFIEFFSIADKQMTIMEGGKLFFTSGGPFLIVGIFLIIMFGTKVFINTQKRKIIVDGEILPFKDLYALQVLEKFISGKSSGGYFCYELNLITKDSKRYNLLSHGDKMFLLSDMMKISKLLKLPVWNKGVV